MFRRVILAAENRLLERWLGVNTRASARDTPGTVEHQYYATIPYRAIFRILNLAQIEPTDIFVDIGCGRGRVLSCAATMKLGGVIGIDDDAQLCADARKNLGRRDGGNVRAEVIQGRAEDFDYSAGNVFFLFNPFGPSTLNQVLARIEQTLAQRSIKIIYVNPVYDSVLATTPWLRRFLDIRPLPFLDPELRVTFWRSRQANSTDF